MTPDERDRMEHLCQRIAVESDRAIFDRLIQELNELLSVKKERISSDGEHRSE